MTRHHCQLLLAACAMLTLAGSAAQMQDKLGKLRDSGVGLLFIPTMFLGKDQLKPLDAFIEKVAPALRK